MTIKNIIKKTSIASIFSGLFITTLSFFIGIQASAQSLNQLNLFKYKCIIGCDNAMLNDIKTFLVGISATIAVLVVIWGGYRFFISTVDDKADAKKTIKNGIFGLITVLMADRIIEIVEDVIGGGNGGFGTEKLVLMIKNVIDFFVPIIGVVTAAYLVYAGYLWVTAGGGDYGDGEAKAKKAAKNAVIGLIVVLMATSISQLIIVITERLKEEDTTETTSLQTIINTSEKYNL